MRKSLEQSCDLSIQEAETEAAAILSYVLGISRTELEIKHNHSLTSKEYEKVKNILDLRLKDNPLQYILEEAYFYGLKFKVNPSVLIPRPETEILLEKAVEIFKSLNKKQLKVLEIGTGSGCLSVALASVLKKKGYEFKIFATDISREALRVAKENAINNSVQEFIYFEYADLLPKKLINQKFDLVISNPPYISESEYLELCSTVYKEPKLALVGNKSPNGLEYYYQIAKLPIEWSHTVMELDPSRADKVKEIYGELGYKTISFIKDLAKQKRFIHIFQDISREQMSNN
ncbi:MAG: peptide chain release factor N(5)-glutamine methyltransferase [Candidatus Caenarcaniphilales bacterium]|nr:peptide chain release factor N(5)-glutamine methyltransferase [Candidatus Caenarcaniphilales bacterium]